MSISTKTNNTALSYLSIITNETVEMIAMKIFIFVEVAILSHRHEETDGFLEVLQGDRGHLRELATQINYRGAAVEVLK